MLHGSVVPDHQVIVLPLVHVQVLVLLRQTVELLKQGVARRRVDADNNRRVAGGGVKVFARADGGRGDERVLGATQRHQHQLGTQAHLD